MAKTKEFDLGTVLTVTTGIFLCGMDNLYEILNFMTGDSLMTHQLPRASDDCKPSLLEQFPELSNITVPELENKEECLEYLDWMARDLGNEFKVEPLKESTYHDPILELQEMMSDDQELIVVQL